MDLREFDYGLPAELIAQQPAAARDASRLLELGRVSGAWKDHLFAGLPQMLGGDELIVVNNARVIPARLLGRRRGARAEPPGRRGRARKEHLKATIEILLLRPTGRQALEWEVLGKPGRKLPVGETVLFGEGELTAEVVGRGDYGLRTVRFVCAGDFRETVERIGHMPLPPYIDRADQPQDRERYQTVFAREWGAVAAPTAGLHFTADKMDQLQQRGCEVAEITLEVGYGTFQPIRTETVERHRMHSERYAVSEETAEAIERAGRQGRPVLAVGTTVVRALESAAAASGRVEPGRGETKLFIYPGFQFRVVNQLLTNFHLPRSSLLILVCAFAGREKLLAAYRHAVEAGYRFYSYGDCMLVR